MTVPYDRELIAQMLDVCGHPMYTLDAYREQARLLREADNADAAKVGTAIANAQQPAAVAPVGVEAIVDRLAADRDYSRGEAVDDLRRALAQQPAAVDDAMVDRAMDAAMEIKHNKETWFPMTRRRMKRALRAALAAQQGGRSDE